MFSKFEIFYERVLKDLSLVGLDELSSQIRLAIEAMCLSLPSKYFLEGGGAGYKNLKILCKRILPVLQPIFEDVFIIILQNMCLLLNQKYMFHLEII